MDEGGKSELAGMRILVIEDDPEFAGTLGEALTETGCSITTATTVPQGLEALQQPHDLLLLDLEVAEQDGMSVLEQVRGDENPMPIIIMTGRRLAPEDSVRGLEGGADDYLRKPFDFQELRARIKAVARRHEASREAVYTFGDLVVDRLHRTVRCGDETVQATLRELELLALLARHGGDEVRRQQILDTVWHDTPGSSSLDNTLDVHLSRLRKKIDEAGSNCRIETAWGKGFRLVRKPGE